MPIEELGEVRCSILMNCRNGGDFLHFALDSLIRQTYQNFEVIFFDNNSSDSSVAIARRYSDRLDINIVEQDFTSSLYAARNKALSFVNGDLLFFLDVDDVWHPKKLEFQIRTFAENEDFVAVCSNYYIVNEEFSSDFEGRYNQLIQAWPNHQSHVVTQDELIYEYKVGLLTLGVRFSILSDRDTSFDGRFTILGDYAIVWDICKIGLIHFSSECLGAYRVHQNNEHVLQKDLYYREFMIWLNENKSELTNQQVSELQKKLMKSQVFHQVVRGDRKGACKTLASLVRAGGNWPTVALLMILAVAPRFVSITIKKLRSKQL